MTKRKEWRPPELLSRPLLLYVREILPLDSFSFLDSWDSLEFFFFFGSFYGFSYPKDTWAWSLLCRVKPAASGCCSSWDCLWSSGLEILKSSFFDPFVCWEFWVLDFLSISTIVFDLGFQDYGICGLRNLEIVMFFSGLLFVALFSNLGDLSRPLRGDGFLWFSFWSFADSPFLMEDMYWLTELSYFSIFNGSTFFSSSYNSSNWTEAVY